jgi:hypothetical protein
MLREIKGKTDLTIAMFIMIFTIAIAVLVGALAYRIISNIRP